MKQIFLISFAWLLLSGIAISTNARDMIQETSDCELAYQVAYNQAFQAEYAVCQDIHDANLAGERAGYYAYSACMGPMGPSEPLEYLHGDDN